MPIIRHRLSDEIKKNKQTKTRLQIYISYEKPNLNIKA